MSNSSLVTYTKLSPNYSKGRVHDKHNPKGIITKITIHHAAGKLTAKKLCDIFAPTSRKASANYCIGYDGQIALCVDESNRAWTSSSASNDYKAVTIEVSNDSGAPNWTISDASMKALLALCIDICERNSIEEIEWNGSKSGTLTCHYMFAATACPGPYLKSKMPWIAEQINAGLKVKEEGIKKEDPVPEKKSGLAAGSKLELKDVNLYASSTSARRASTKTGIYYLWDDEVVNNRVKITNSTSNVGKEGQITGWINELDAKGSLVKKEEPTKPKKLSTEELAKEIKAGKWGNEPERSKKLKAAGYTDAEIKTAQNLINKDKENNTESSPISKGNLVKIKSSATKWATGQPIPNWVKSKTLYVRSNPLDNKCQVSTVKTGAITGVAFVKDLKKV